MSDATPRSDARIGLRFDTVAERYHAVRPRYPGVIWDELLGITGLKPSDREHYLSLISTYSTTLRLPEANRAGLLRCIGELMDRELGGRITRRYRFDLVVRRRA
jgi:hypothetical protein